jgi:hypothetical protein
MTYENNNNKLKKNNKNIYRYNFVLLFLSCSIDCLCVFVCNCMYPLLVNFSVNLKSGCGQPKHICKGITGTTNTEHFKKAQNKNT